MRAQTNMTQRKEPQGGDPCRYSPRGCLRWISGVLLRFGLVALLALLITTGALFIDCDQTAVLNTRSHNSVGSAMEWGKVASARGFDQLGAAYHSAVKRIRPSWVAASWHSSSATGAVTDPVKAARRCGGTGGGGIELSWRQLHSVKANFTTRVTADSTPKSR